MLKDFMLINQHYHDINPLLCGEEFCAGGHCFGPASREYYLLHYVLSGKGTYFVGGKNNKVCKGDIFVIRPFEFTYYEADQEDPWHYCWIGFESNLDLSKLFVSDVLHVPECEHIFDALRDCEQLTMSKELFVCAKIYELIAILQEKRDKTEYDKYHYVLTAKNYIEANYMNHLSVEMIAKHLNLDRSYFSVTFKRYTGKSPQQYIVDFRLIKAAELISLRNYKPGDAARSTGYTDTFNFSKMFKKKFGVAPKYYKFGENQKKIP